jgi:hypothetical protein
MPADLTLGHILMALAGLAAVHGLWQLAILARYRGPGHGRGTPGYARRRDARRYAVWSLAAAALLLAVGCYTPLAHMALAG